MDERAYKCWFEFLKRSDRYKECCLQDGQGDLASLYADFGNVHADGLQWSDWWATHQDLFSEVEPLFVLNEVSTRAEFDCLFEEDQDDLLALIINLHAPKQTILNEVDALIRRLQLQKRRRENALVLHRDPNAKVTERFGRPKQDASFYHRYGLTPVPNSDLLEVLERILEVYDACTDAGRVLPRNVEEWCEIADYLGVMVIPTLNTARDQGPKTKEEEIAEKVQKTQRYFKQATELIANVELGIFPKHS